MKFYNVIFTKTARAEGLAFSTMSESEIVDMATAEFQREGGRSETFAGIGVFETEDGDIKYDRELAGDELFEVCVQKMGDDGRFFEVFPDTPDGREKFAGRLVELGVNHGY